MKNERATEFIKTETVISFAEYLLLLCRSLESVEKAEEAEKVEEVTES